jgi:hypothetical protein
MTFSALPQVGMSRFEASKTPEKGDRLLKSKRMLLAVSATVAVAAAGTWGAVAMAASSPSTTTPKSQTAPKSSTPKSHSAHQGNCPNMGSSSGTSSNTMYAPPNV